jgi:hypothetical protein
MRGRSRDNRPPCREPYPGSPLSEVELVTTKRRRTVYSVIVLVGYLSHCTGESFLHWAFSCKCNAKRCLRPSLFLEQNVKFFFLRPVRSTAEFKTTSFKLETKFKKKLNCASFAFAQKLTSIYLPSETRYDSESFAVLAVISYSCPLKPHEV